MEPEARSRLELARSKSVCDAGLLCANAYKRSLGATRQGRATVPTDTYRGGGVDGMSEAGEQFIALCDLCKRNHANVQIECNGQDDSYEITMNAPRWPMSCVVRADRLDWGIESAIRLFSKLNNGN